MLIMPKKQPVFANAEPTPKDASPTMAMVNTPVAGAIKGTPEDVPIALPAINAISCTEDAHAEAQQNEASSPPNVIEISTKDSDATDPPYQYSYFELADRFIARHGQDIKHCCELDTTFVWDGRRFAPDRGAKIERLAMETIRAIKEEVAAVADKGRRRAAMKLAKRYQTPGHLSATISLAIIDERLQVEKAALDADEYLFNCNNGTIDLKTGIRRGHRREDLITKLSPVDYDVDAPCPRFLAFLDRIMDNNQGMVSFLQRAIGYSLTKSIKEQVLFVCVGSGANGKSTLMQVATTALGDYSMWADDKLLITKKGDGPRNDIAGLEGAHMVVTAETAEGAALNEAVVKTMTGGDTVISRRLFKEFTAQRVTFKIWLSTNKKPVIKGSDYAIWRRILLVLFLVTIPPAEQNKELLAGLLAELPGFLAWAVRGCLEWQKIGLCPPDEVLQATKEYKEESDVLQDFLGDCCIVDKTNKNLCVLNSELYPAYRKHCLQNWNHQKHIMTAAVLGKALSERGFPNVKKNGLRFKLGLALKQID